MESIQDEITLVRDKINQQNIEFKKYFNEFRTIYKGIIAICENIELNKENYRLLTDSEERNFEIFEKMNLKYCISLNNLFKEANKIKSEIDNRYSFIIKNYKGLEKKLQTTSISKLKPDKQMEEILIEIDILFKNAEDDKLKIDDFLLNFNVFSQVPIKNKKKIKFTV